MDVSVERRQPIAASATPRHPPRFYLGAAVRYTLLETTRQLAEGAGAAALAAAWRLRDDLAGRKVAVVLSGGNLTLDALAQALAEERPW